MYLDIYIANLEKWYEFKCEEKEYVEDFIKAIYKLVSDIENIKEQDDDIVDLWLSCIERKRVLGKHLTLEECGVVNGNRLILF